MVERSRAAAALPRACAALALACAAPAGSAGTARAAGEEPRPPVSITVHQSARELTEGDSATYAITVRNRGARDLPHTSVVQVLPDALREPTAQPSARTSGRQVTWRVRLPAHARRTLTLTGTVGAAGPAASPVVTPVASPRPTGAVAAADTHSRDPHHLSTTVCVRARAEGPLLTCATSTSPVTRPAWPASKVSMAVSAAAALLVGVVGVVLLRRRRAVGVA